MPTNQGLTLDRFLSEKGPLEPARVVRIGIQIAQQMGSLSGSFLIHPGRILATKEGTVHLLPPPAEDLALPAMVELPAYASPTIVTFVDRLPRNASGKVLKRVLREGG